VLIGYFNVEVAKYEATSNAENQGYVTRCVQTRTITFRLRQDVDSPPIAASYAGAREVA
jgi:hypothetical protein